MNQKEYIREKLLKELDLSITDLQAEQLLMYYTMMIEKNKVMNLTRITDFEEAVDKHFVDSLAIVKVLDPKQFAGCRMIDLGSGAGLPGVPIKIV
ncbi:MAG: class I SAM-dependent methyltransferase, partial [Lachnospiraceae bacterium]|nr:class I SAM-dependent methyltransferase [Lachnospiraceae bacterium]